MAHTMLTKFETRGTKAVLLGVLATTIIMVIGSGTNAGASETGCIHGSTLLNRETGISASDGRLGARKQRLTACDSYTYTQMAFLFPNRFGLVSLDNLETPAFFSNLPAELQFFILTKMALQMAEHQVADDGKFESEYQRVSILKIKEIASQLLDGVQKWDLFEPERRAYYLSVVSALSTRPIFVDGDKVLGLYFEADSAGRSKKVQAYCFVRSDIASLTIDEVTGSPLFRNCMEGVTN